MPIVKDTSAPLIVVIGATGIQGGSVIRALAASDKPYRIRGLTRDASTTAAQELAKQGVEMYAVNLAVENAPAVKDAFKGADIAFLVTNYWAHANKEQDIAEGKLFVDAALEGGATRILWSGLESFAEASGGKLANAHHFESKAQITKYARTKLAGTGTFVLVAAGLYMSNLSGLAGMMPRRQADGSFVLVLPTAGDAKLPWIDMKKDYGYFVRLGIEDPAYAQGGDIYSASEELSLNEVAQQLSEVLGKTVNYMAIPADAFKEAAVATGIPEPIALAFTENLVGYTDYGYYCGKPLTSHANLAKKPRTFKEFAADEDWSKVLASD